MDNRVSITKQKVKRSKPLKYTVLEMQRDDETAHIYDNGNRKLNLDKVGDNVVLLRASANQIDAQRESRIDDFNRVKKERDIDRGRALRSDANDVMSYVVQFSVAYCESRTDEQLREDYEKAFEVMRDDKDEYGELLCAVIHFDETTPHMQVLGSTLDVENGKNNCKAMYGEGRSAMSAKQTRFAEQLREKGLDVSRGVSRVGTTRTEQQKEFREKFGEKMTRENEHLATQMLAQSKEIENGKAAISKLKDSANSGRIAVVQSLQAIDPQHRVPVEYFGKAQRKYSEEREEISTEVGEKQHLSLTVNVLADLYRKAQARVIAMLNERMRAQEERERDLKEREEKVQKDEQRVSETLERAEEVHANTENLVKSVKSKRVLDLAEFGHAARQVLSDDEQKRVDFKRRFLFGSMSKNSEEYKIRKAWERERGVVPGVKQQKQKARERDF